MAEDFGPEVFTRASSRNFLEEEEDWFACFGGCGKGGIVVGLPIDGSDFGRGLIAITGCEDGEEN